jgi:hypothetical protein
MALCSENENWLDVCVWNQTHKEIEGFKLDLLLELLRGDDKTEKSE